SPAPIPTRRSSSSARAILSATPIQAPAGSSSTARSACAIPGPRRRRAARVWLVLPGATMEGAAKPPQLNPAIGEIFGERIARSGSGGEGDVGVGAEQIEPVLGQSGLPVFQVPGKNLEGQVVRVAPCAQSRTGSAVDMDLPGRRREGRVIVDIADRDPRQPVAAPQFARFACAQRALPIID